MLDLRLVQVGIEINGVEKRYNTLRIYAVGVKFANANQNECEIQISNLDKSTQDYILTETSPFNANTKAKTIRLYAGRESYGLSEIYSGTIVSVKVSQPPDVTILIRALTGDFAKTNVISRYSSGLTNLSDIATNVAKELGLSLNFNATDKTISNYNFNGSALNELSKLNLLSAINAFQDDNSLIVTNYDTPLPNVIREINIDTGLIGIPEITERGLKVVYLFDNVSRVGGLLRVKSQIYPIVNGDYLIFKLGFEIANRDEPFYYIAEAKRLP